MPNEPVTINSGLILKMIFSDDPMQIAGLDGRISTDPIVVIGDVGEDINCTWRTVRNTKADQTRLESTGLNDQRSARVTLFSCKKILLLQSNARRLGMEHSRSELRAARRAASFSLLV